MSEATFGVIGLGVMGRNIALNILDSGERVSVWNRSPEKVRIAVDESNGRFIATESVDQLIAGLDAPRRILLMVDAGRAVDLVLEGLAPKLAPGDIVIDGGNSWFEDTQRRERECRERGLRFVGMGVSGGEEGARYGPSLMPGGDAEAYAALAPVLEKIAAKSDSGPCVTHVGADGAGHFVKMVHNGIEYADMQAIAEAYDCLARGLGHQPPQLAETFARWNEGPLESFLIELTAECFRTRDPEGDGWLVDAVLDRAGQKGTGRWTARLALDLGVPIPSIAAAIDARVLSSRKDQRERFEGQLTGPTPRSGAFTVDDVEQALTASKILAYAQGYDLIRAGAEANDWTIDLAEMGRIWKAGCIIRARFLDVIRRVFEADPALENLAIAPEVSTELQRTLPALRRTVAAAATAGIPTPAFASSLAYYDALRTARLPQNLVQAQRDAFGAHTYHRLDDRDGDARHSSWGGA
ncbi:MAG: NADP-dependent phosphogluconate dehydrogenase [Planctomycetota bacterium]